ncbi:MAG: sulfite exporter TauE/SafE family protein [Hamadaea sp.]|uniref:sulfite exporter TauE/SafE family protein n=1 Tax=Hamadaea sp. TaxID=2024425 RepID=UPI0017C3DD25|nr:sulfite exporter TauE/SafE family protein [Hamadaea sp.]NUT17944.1 sulfite exporter TauE/SafE family protein [Hamadaea sp.]
MQAQHVVVLLAAGFGAGAVNAAAGGGSLISFPALIATGLPPKIANVTNSVAVCPGYLASVAGSWRDVGDERRTLLRLLPTIALGTATGCALLLVTSAEAFERVVPFLVLAAAAVLAFQDRLKAVVGHPHQMSTRKRAVALHGLVGLGCVYGGYFGAALGVMLVAVLGLLVDGSLRQITAMKNVVSAAEGLVTIAYFAVFADVQWSAVALLAPATIAGGYAGARIARRIPQRILRAGIVAYAVVIAGILFVRAF